MPHKFDNSAASDKAIKKEVQARGLGVPQSTGQSHGHQIFQNTNAAHDAPDGPATPTFETKNPGSAGTDSKVGAAGATGSIGITSDSFTSNVPPEYKN
ncbi:hypothetical protein CYLTODRAFT_426300 [Cylindrobasidium torrendii FP15055 ss-10]|uniref:Uncharacterized protein n=1 Tax=Cylindrobasidium torrendii FP15055 ss-10 TaxID=1314674 RepID=A0A0D7AZ92_9AGAR|nr:hypothetical protein CYLTODRAFT_426300 [Cylindrobasidium torrendii FP15055 ss-10]